MQKIINQDYVQYYTNKTCIRLVPWENIDYLANKTSTYVVTFI